MLARREGRGTPLLLIHGAGVDHRALLPLEQLFTTDPHLDGTWERWYVDLPGSGENRWHPGIDSSDAVLDQLDGFVGAELGDRRFAVLGNSWGGMLTRGLVERRAAQVLGMGLLCPAVVADRTRRDLPPRPVLVHDPDLLAGLDPGDRAEYEQVSVVQTAENFAAFSESVLAGVRGLHPGSLEAIEQNYALTVEPRAVFARPSLVVTGRQDDTTGYRDPLAQLEQYPRATFAVLDTAGHNALLDRPAACRALVADWLERIELTP
ncbi:alpha/beta hydrolase [Kineococcus sp. NBC_00420]|uniref:alpha/beta fold hydrolase n=1 Tax=Kineococcus sp. NBC_00420 TaxID=2903564 RepID=UPI002E23E363